MKLLLHVFLLLSIPMVVLGNENNLPFDKSHLEKTYQLDNGNIIYIEQYERGDRIWEKDISTGKINNISFVWNFIALAKSCEGIKEENIYFATNLEYYLGGGTDVVFTGRNAAAPSGLGSRGADYDSRYYQSFWII